MKVKSITLDNDENPAAITVEMTADEAAYIARLTGSQSPKSVEHALGDDRRWYLANSSVYNSLAGVFNSFYDGGVDDVIPPRGGTT